MSKPSTSVLGTRHCLIFTMGMIRHFKKFGIQFLVFFILVFILLIKMLEVPFPNASLRSCTLTLKMYFKIHSATLTKSRGDRKKNPVKKFSDRRKELSKASFLARNMAFGINSPKKSTNNVEMIVSTTSIA